MHIHKHQHTFSSLPTNASCPQETNKTFEGHASPHGESKYHGTNDSLITNASMRLRAACIWSGVPHIRTALSIASAIGSATVILASENSRILSKQPPASPQREGITNLGTKTSAVKFGIIDD
uniref:Uncharacterized protein n=1 Tax=Arundo donax TaxID=35708 RepID=A0A0A9G103_ARUDO